MFEYVLRISSQSILQDNREQLKHVFYILSNLIVDIFIKLYTHTIYKLMLRGKKIGFY